MKIFLRTIDTNRPQLAILACAVIVRVIGSLHTYSEAFCFIYLEKSHQLISKGDTMIRTTAVFAVLFLSVSTFSLRAFALDGGGSGGSDYQVAGEYATTRESGGRSCTVYRPRNLEGGHGVILWGNGTGASPRTYSALLSHWASWGFVVVAANTSSAGSGREMLSCLDWLERSTLSAFVDFSKVATSGHSQGGGGAIMAGVDRRIKTTAPIQGYTLGLGHNSSSQSQQNGPMLLLSGSSDTLVNPTTNHAPVFRRANVPVFWAILRGASHFEPVPDGGSYRPITTAWFLYQLNGNADAAEYFEGQDCVYCTDRNWEVSVKN